MKPNQSLIDFAIQVEGRKLEVRNNIEEAEALSIVSEEAPQLCEKLARLDTQIKAIQKDIVSDPDNTVEYYMLASAQARADELLNCDLRARTEKEQAERIGQYHRYTSVGSALLYEHASFRGSTKFFSITWPNFKWWPYKFNDRVSSAKVWGINVLFEHTWYRGKRLWLIGYPYAEFSNFKHFGFNDVASSIICFG